MSRPEPDDSTGVISNQPTRVENALSQLNKTLSNQELRADVAAKLGLLIQVLRDQKDLPFNHCSLIEWPCEKGTNITVANAVGNLEGIRNALQNEDTDFSENDKLSKLCWKYKALQPKADSEKGVTQSSELAAIGCMVSGVLLLGLIPGVAKISGAGALICSGVSAGVAQAHHGNAIRVASVDGIFSQAIELIAGTEFLKELQNVQTNEEFRSLLNKENIYCSERLRITERRGLFTSTVQTLLGINPAQRT
jgi:hypothetical protein